MMKPSNIRDIRQTAYQLIQRIDIYENIPDNVSPVIKDIAYEGVECMVKRLKELFEEMK